MYPSRVLGVLRRVDAHPEKGEAAPEGLDQAEVGKGVAQPDGVVVELAAVVDATEPRAQQELVRGQHLVPELLDGAHLGEEPVAADVEPPAVALDRPADPAHHLVSLDHHDRVTGGTQPMGGGQAGGASPDDDDWCSRRHRRLVLHHCHQLCPLRSTL